MASQRIDNEPIAPSADELPALGELDRLVRAAAAGELTLGDASGERVVLPESAVRLLRQALDALKRDQVVTVDRMLKDMTVADAARLLRVPRSEVTALIKEGKLSSEERLGFRRVFYDEVMIIKRQLDEERARILTELAQEGQEIERGFAALSCRSRIVRSALERGHPRRGSPRARGRYRARSRPNSSAH